MMKKGIIILASVVFTVTLAMPVWGAEAPKLGVSDQKQQIQQMPPQGVVVPDFKVERVFIAKADAPNVPFAGPFSTEGNYSLACEISYAGRKSTEYPCAGIGASAVIVFKVDGSIILDLNSGCLAPNELKTFSSNIMSQSYMERAFTAGSHTYECLITSMSLTDSNAGNNSKSMMYQINRTKMDIQPKPHDERRKER